MDLVSVRKEKNPSLFTVKFNEPALGKKNEEDFQDHLG